LAIFSSHTPYELRVPAKAIKNGLYKELYGLQGAEEEILRRCRVRRAGLQPIVAVYRGATATGRGVKEAVIGTGSLD
jgi:hypothetical protein